MAAQTRCPAPKAQDLGNDITQRSFGKHLACQHDPGYGVREGCRIGSQIAQSRFDDIGVAICAEAAFQEIAGAADKSERPGAAAPFHGDHKRPTGGTHPSPGWDSSGGVGCHRRLAKGISNASPEERVESGPSRDWRELDGGTCTSHVWISVSRRELRGLFPCPCPDVLRHGGIPVQGDPDVTPGSALQGRALPRTPLQRLLRFRSEKGPNAVRKSDRLNAKKTPCGFRVADVVLL